MLERVVLSVFLIFLSTAQLAAEGKVGSVEFFGSKGIDLTVIRRVLSVRPGSVLQPGWETGVRNAVLHITGKAPTDVTAVCCDETRAQTIFIGLKGASYRAMMYSPAPEGSEHLPHEVLALYGQEESALEAAVTGGHAGEDDSNGYALSEDPASRAIEIKIRQFAIDHAGELEAVVLHAANRYQREAGSEFLGYAAASRGQVRVLTHALNDPDDEVRNNATRALAILLRARPEFSKDVDIDKAVALLYSGIWSDRNKGAFLLDAMTASRNPQMLSSLHEKAWAPLIEMAEWSDTAHAVFSRMVVGRVLGIPEDHLQKLVWSEDLDEFMKDSGTSRTAR